VIPTHYTPGGHRRIALSSVIQFIKSGRHDLVRPEVLGLPDVSGRTDVDLPQASRWMPEALLCGDELRCRRLAIDLYLAEHSIASICDDVLAVAMREIGDRWECSRADVYQERRGCEIVLRLLHELRSIIPSLSNGAPLAMGGAASGDQYHLATTMVELVLRENRWNAVSLGDNLPFENLASAIGQEHPRLFWLSASHLPDRQAFLEGYSALYERFGLSVPFVVGGRALTEEVRRNMRYAAHCDNLKHLESFAHSLWSGNDAPAASDQPGGTGADEA